jgi:hypothetical protein
MLAVTVWGSCIFQNDPLAPNSLPIIEFSQPPIKFPRFMAPDSCLFVIRASDADGDELEYRFMLDDSLLGTGDSVMFYASDSGDYHLVGSARDGSGSAEREWFVTVTEEHNDPPFIVGFLPAQHDVACVVGETLEFTFSVIDDKPEDLQYTYELSKVGQSAIHRFYGSPKLQYRFLERGEFDLLGIVWDGQFADSTSWYIAVTGDPDTIPPGAITDLEGGTGTDLGSIWLTWTAPGDDGTEGTVSAYEVRTSTEPILTEQDWAEASRKNNTPHPSPAGSAEAMIARGLNPGTYAYVMIRAIDDFFNYSPLGNCIHLLVRGIDASGTVYNMHSGEACAGVFVESHGISDTTSADGRYLLKNLPYYISTMRAIDEYIYGSIGDFYDCIVPIYDPGNFIEIDFHLMPALGIVNSGNPRVYNNSFITFFKEVTATSGLLGKPTVFKGWNHWPITVYCPAKVFEDVDLQAAARGAMDEWEEMTGYDLFIEIDQSSAADLRIVYNDELDNKHHYSTVELNPDGTPKVRMIEIYTANTSMPVTRYPHLIFAHELGHVLGFMVHSSDPGHLMLGLTTPLVHHVTTDEANVIRILHNMPGIFDYKVIITE